MNTEPNEALIEAELAADQHVAVCRRCGFVQSFRTAGAATAAVRRHRRMSSHDPQVESPPD